MNLQIEILKQKSIQFSVDLVQKRLSDDLVNDLINIEPGLKEKAILFRDINSKEDLRQLKDLVKSISPGIDRSLLDDIKEEMREITDDFKWSQSREGKAVMELEAWVVGAREKLSPYSEFQNVFVGRSLMDPLVLIISGVVENDVVGKKLLALVREWGPPVNAKYFIEPPERGQGLAN